MIEMKITYEPFEEIVIKDVVKFEELNDLLYAFAQLRAAGQPVALNWAEGVALPMSLCHQIQMTLCRIF